MYNCIWKSGRQCLTLDFIHWQSVNLLKVVSLEWPKHVSNVLSTRWIKDYYQHAFQSPFFLSRPAGLAGSPVISDISLIRVSPHAAATGESPFSPSHAYVNPHMEQYLRSVHNSPTLSVLSAARGLSPSDGKSNTKRFCFTTFYLATVKPCFCNTYADMLASHAS